MDDGLLAHFDLFRNAKSVAAGFKRDLAAQHRSDALVVHNAIHLGEAFLQPARNIVGYGVNNPALFKDMCDTG